MAYTTNQLITNSFYLAGVVSRDLQTVSGAQITDGLNLLNDLLAIKSANVRLIPYFDEYDFPAVVNQEKYFIPNLLSVETFTFNIGPVRYSMQPVNRKVYFGAGRIDNIGSLPFNWHLERTFGGSNLYVYFLPSSNYPMKIHGQFALTSVALGQDLSLTLDQFYITYLRYGLAEYIANDYNITMQPQNYEKLRAMEQMIQDISPPDLSLTHISMFTERSGITWADVNLGQGWSIS